jgi:sodium--glutamate symport carrier gltS
MISGPKRCFIPFAYMDCDVVGLAGPIVAILGVQFILAFCFALFFVFRLMGRDYEAAVICSGFGEIYFGSTSTPTPMHSTMANMSVFEALLRCS